MFSGAIAGCSRSTTEPRTEASPTPTTLTESTPTTSPSSAIPALKGVQQWTPVKKGDSAGDLSFTTDGKLLYQGKTLLNEVPVSYGSDGTVTYAGHLLLSDPSPSGRFRVVKACERSINESGLCWSVFLVDRQAQTAQKIDVAKYGGQNWVQWSADERYAVFAESMEGVTWFVVLDSQTGKTKMFDQTATTADLSSFTWEGDRTFQAKLFCGEGAGASCTESQFRGDITALFSSAG